MVEISKELIGILTNTAFSNDPLRCLLKSMCSKIMDAEVTLQVNAQKSDGTHCESSACAVLKSCGTIAVCYCLYCYVQVIGVGGK